MLASAWPRRKRMRSWCAWRRAGTSARFRRWWSSISGASPATSRATCGGRATWKTWDTFIRAYRGLVSFRGESSFYSWLYRIATNAAFSFLKKTAGEVEADERSDEGFEPGVSDEQTPERILLASQIGDAVERAMARLQPELAEALVLFEVEGKSYKEIAQMLGTPIGTVRTRIFRAREFIARRLEPVLGPARGRRW